MLYLQFRTLPIPTRQEREEQKLQAAVFMPQAT
jgi:hypothetical protein